MKLGVCTGIENIKIAEKCGCDYIELNFTILADMSDDEFIDVKNRAQETSLPIYAANCFIPARFSLTGKDADLKEIPTYVKKGMERCKVLGIKRVVFGSGDARMVPEGYTQDKAYAQLKDFLLLVEPIAKACDVIIAIEPLGYSECNIINLVSDGVKLADMVRHASIGSLADLYHMGKNGERMTEISTAMETMEHVHIAHPVTRNFPTKSDGYDYVDFFDNLNEIAYIGGVSIEGSTEDFENDLCASIKYLRTFII